MTGQGCRCVECGVVAYSSAPTCPRCGQRTQPCELSRRGTLWTWTVQRHAPKSPPFAAPTNGYRPFMVGYVELPEGLRVEAILDVSLGDVHIGMALDLSYEAGVPRAIRVEGS